jgi:hypothetical protein
MQARTDKARTDNEEQTDTAERKKALTRGPLQLVEALHGGHQVQAAERVYELEAHGQVPGGLHGHQQHSLVLGALRQLLLEVPVDGFECHGWSGDCVCIAIHNIQNID